MPVYNGEKYLNAAIDSILNQTFPNFEFIIINDGSTDKTEDIILSYKDIRIRYVKNEVNLQIVKTLNKGIKLAKAKYIARMDADDISSPKRFETQIEFMENNINIDICGTWMKSTDNKYMWKYPKNHDEIKAQMIFNSALSGASTIIRRSFFDTFKFNNNYNKAEDYYLWCCAIDSKRFYNLPKTLYCYRLHDEMTNVVARSKQISVANNIRKKMIERTGIIVNDYDLKLHIHFSLQELDIKNINKTILWLGNILNNNKKLKYYDDLALKKAIGEYWWQLFSQNTNLGLSVYKTFMLSSLKKYSEISFTQYIKFLTKCLIKYKYKR